MGLLHADKSVHQVRQGQQTRDSIIRAETFLRLALAGRDDDASKLGRRAMDAGEIRNLDGFQSLRIAAFYAGPEAALAITSKVNYRGQEHSLVIRMAFDNNHWSIDDIDLETENGLKEEKDRFLKEHPLE